MSFLVFEERNLRIAESKPRRINDSSRVIVIVIIDQLPYAEAPKFFMRIGKILRLFRL